MKNFKIISFFCVVILFSAIIFAANDMSKEVPPWMEDVKIRGRSTYLVPKGVKRKTIGSQIIVEPTNEYVARRIYEIELYVEDRFAQIEKTQAELRRKLEDIENILEEVQKEQIDQQDPVSQ